jgi:CHAT domain-containing protein
MVHEEKPDSSPRFTRDPKRPYAHPYYWAPFILIGNWR